MSLLNSDILNVRTQTTKHTGTHLNVECIKNSPNGNSHSKVNSKCLLFGKDKRTIFKIIVTITVHNDLLRLNDDLNLKRAGLLFT